MELTQKQIELLKVAGLSMAELPKTKLELHRMIWEAFEIGRKQGQPKIQVETDVSVPPVNGLRMKPSAEMPNQNGWWWRLEYTLEGYDFKCPFHIVDGIIIYGLEDDEPMSVKDYVNYCNDNESTVEWAGPIPEPMQ